MVRKFITVLAFAGLAAAAKNEPAEAQKRVQEADRVLREIMDVPDKGIPQDLMDKAHCVAIVPSMKQGGFIVGAKYGKGVLMCRKAHGGWKGPATVRVEGGSFGLQIGGGEVDVVLLIMNASGAEKIMKSQFKIGGEAGAMAGPVGRTVQAETDAYMRAEILGYSRSRGVFAGIALSGSTLREDLDDNEALYGSRMTSQEILDQGRAPAPNAAKPLIGTLNRYSMWEKK
jgi:lipid-binding SYLF domain-containing protein